MKTKKSAGYNILLIFWVILLSIMAVKAWDAPIVMKDRNGNTCGCMLPDHEVPSLENCKLVNFNKAYEVYGVSHCGD